MMATKKDSSANTDQVFDVAKPGTSKPDTGSKPMVIGHKNNTDPSIKNPNDSDEKDEKKEKVTIGSTKKIKIEPISHDVTDDKKEDKEVDSKAKNEESNEDKKTEPSKDDSPPEDYNDNQDNDNSGKLTEEEKRQKEKDEQLDEQLQKQKNLNNIIASKKYFVRIDGSRSSLKTFLIAFFSVLVIGLAAIVVLIDAEILDLGLELPFDLF